MYLFNTVYPICTNNVLKLYMATKTWPLATKLFPLVASWVLETKLILSPVIYKMVVTQTVCSSYVSGYKTNTFSFTLFAVCERDKVAGGIWTLTGTFRYLDHKYR